MAEELQPAAGGRPEHPDDAIHAGRQRRFDAILTSVLQNPRPAAGSGLAAALCDAVRSAHGGATVLVAVGIDAQTRCHAFGDEAFERGEGEAWEHARATSLEVGSSRMARAASGASGAEACAPFEMSGRGALFASAPDAEPRELLISLQMIAACSGRLAATRSPAEATRVVAAGDHSLSDAKRFFERELIVNRLEANAGNIAAAARDLHMDRGQLSRLVKRHGIDKSQFRNRNRDH